MSEDRRIEHLFVECLADLAPSRAPDRVRHDIKHATRQQRPRPRWLALIKEPPMRTSSTLAVGSPTARVAALVAATLLAIAALAGAGIAGAHLLAADGTIVVDQSGGGDFSTIAEAVAAATDGDSILVRPGRYVENVTVADNDLTISGDGDRDAIVLEAPGAEPFLELTNSDSVVSGITLSGPGSAVIVQGGSPTLTGILFDHVGRSDSAASVVDGLVINVRATPTVADNEFAGGGWIRVQGGSAPVIEGNVLHDGPMVAMSEVGEGTVVHGNSITDAPFSAIGIWGPGSPLIEDNVIRGAEVGIQVGDPTIAAYADDPIIRANTISDVLRGIEIAPGAGPTIEANDLSATEHALAFAGPGTAAISGNTICGGQGITTVAEGMDAPDLEGNDLCEVPPAESPTP